ncbi:helix-turn-helix domain-containing protein [Hymenobacter sp. IS2118]|uniref:helix-turn-helix domain-containing protein n=1 Tax=Hymenobacter sp. IS2118 TaxID=1505605 RepID=UPI00068BE42A|nr:AraC family transcriptional regulator [Hymenobacter sp. IS2118]
MTSSAKGPTHPFRSEAAGARNRSDANTAPHLASKVPHNRLTAGHHQRAHHKAHLIDNIKQAIAELVLATGDDVRTKNSAYLSRRLSHDYTYLANLFSGETGSTIEQYIIEFKIDRVKELLLSSELTLTQISYQLRYSSVAHLSNQFKKVTGLTPSAFRGLHRQHGIMAESVNVVTVFCNSVNIPEVRRVRFAM